jgi:hypothetical protein
MIPPATKHAAAMQRPRLKSSFKFELSLKNLDLYSAVSVTEASVHGFCPFQRGYLFAVRKMDAINSGPKHGLLRHICAIDLSNVCVITDMRKFRARFEIDSAGYGALAKFSVNGLEYVAIPTLEFDYEVCSDDWTRY